MPSAAQALTSLRLGALPVHSTLSAPTRTESILKSVPFSSRTQWAVHGGDSCRVREEAEAGEMGRGECVSALHVLVGAR